MSRSCQPCVWCCQAPCYPKILSRQSLDSGKMTIFISRLAETHPRSIKRIRPVTHKPHTSHPLTPQSPTQQVERFISAGVIKARPKLLSIGLRVLSMLLYHERCSNSFVCWNKLWGQTPHWIHGSVIDELLGQHWPLTPNDLQQHIINSQEEATVDLISPLHYNFPRRAICYFRV